MNILSKLLEFRGIKDQSELSSEEKLQLENWKKILEKDEVGVEDILKFCDTAIITIEGQFGNPEAGKDKIQNLALQHAIYKAITRLIKAPKVEKEVLVEYLTSLMGK